MIDNDGSRADRHVHSRRQPRRQPNPVVTSVLRGDRFVGRAYVVDAWYIAAPTSRSAMPRGPPSGCSTSAFPRSEVVAPLLDKLKTIKVGKTGYIFILRGNGADRGSYVMSADRKRDGENIWDAKDSDGILFIQKIVEDALSAQVGRVGEVRYPWKNPGESDARMKTARFTYFEPWDWVIASSVYEDELLAAAAEIERLNRRSNMLLALATLLAAVAAVVVWTFVSRRLTGQIRMIVCELREGTGQVVSASAQVASSAQTLSQGATEQAASLEETSASMEEMASMTRKNSEHAQTVASLMADVERAGAPTRTRRSPRWSAPMAWIQDSSRQVAKIIKTIDEHRVPDQHPRAECRCRSRPRG